MDSLASSLAAEIADLRARLGRAESEAGKWKVIAESLSRDRPRPHLVNSGAVKLHSGGVSNVKFDLDALTDEDLAAIAAHAAPNLPRFSRVHGVPRGGLRMAAALEPYRTDELSCVLIVDDVLTTGRSMEEAKAAVEAAGATAWWGFVILNRSAGAIPNWISAYLHLEGRFADRPAPPPPEPTDRPECHVVCDLCRTAVPRTEPWSDPAGNPMGRFCEKCYPGVARTAMVLYGKFGPSPPVTLDEVRGALAASVTPVQPRGPTPRPKPEPKAEPGEDFYYRG